MPQDSYLSYGKHAFPSQGIHANEMMVRTHHSAAPELLDMGMEHDNC